MLVNTRLPLRYCLDAGFSQEAAERVRAEDIDVIHVTEIPDLAMPGGASAEGPMPDATIAAWCNSNGRILVVIDPEWAGRSPRASAFRDAGIEVICFNVDVAGVVAQRKAVVDHVSHWEAALGAVEREPRVWLQRRDRRRPTVFDGRRSYRRPAEVSGRGEMPRRKTARARRSKRRKRVLGDQPIYRYSFEWLPGATVLAERYAALEAGAELYSSHYGRWGPQGRRPGEWIRMSPDRLAEELRDEDTCMALAWNEHQLVGYCIAVRFELPGGGRVAWVSQLVVHADHRNYGVGTKLLYSVWQFSDCFAWGLATANPRAVRALEKATRRRANADLICAHAPGLLPALHAHVDYIPDALVVERGKTVPRVDTKFHIDLSEMGALRSRSVVRGQRWALGPLPSGQEWLACTFGTQSPDAMSAERLDELLHGTDRIWIDAFERMTLDSRHTWRAHAPSEVQYAVDVAGLSPGSKVLDVGCGDGRHSEVLRDLGFHVTATDISPGLIERARERLGDSVELRVADARTDDLGGPYDLVLCLYDVVGSSARSDEDQVLLRNLRRALRPGATLLVSTMNANVTLDRMPVENRPAEDKEFIRRLETLPPSNTMETSGQIFDESRILFFRGVHYRKEQFELTAGRLPVEAVVRDLRYTPETLRELFSKAGMPGATVRPVSLGRWASDLRVDAHDLAAKELLATWQSS